MLLHEMNLLDAMESKCFCRNRDEDFALVASSLVAHAFFFGTLIVVSYLKNEEENVLPKRSLHLFLVSP